LPPRRGKSADDACAYRITGPRTNRQSRALGIDGVQAMLLALAKIGAGLRASPTFEAGPLRWFDMDEPGFPLPTSMAHLGCGRAPSV
jgi:hypothetical protein